MLKKTQGVGPIRKVVLVKDDHEGLGISITVRYYTFFFSLFVIEEILGHLHQLLWEDHKVFRRGSMQICSSALNVYL